MRWTCRADGPPLSLVPLAVPPARPPQAYKPLRTFVALVGMEIWSSGDQISVTPPAGANLEAFRKWRNDHLVKRKKHDNAHLIRWGGGFPRPHRDRFIAGPSGTLVLLSLTFALWFFPAGSTSRGPRWGWPTSGRCARVTRWAWSR